jgi:cytochrome subunit of sulfide dehydrogenase
MFSKTAISFQPHSLLLPRTFISFGISGCFLILITLFLLPHTALSAEDNAQNHHEIIHIRTLAASCAACHGTQGNSHSTTPVLAGLDSSYFATQMLAFKNGSRDSTVMHHHAKGLTIDEISQLSNYFATQKRISTPSPTPVALKAQHE